jgi:hypothetical protein
MTSPYYSGFYGVRGGTAHRVWWKRMTSPYCSGFLVCGAERPTVRGGKGWRHSTVQGFRCEGRNGRPCVVEKDDITLLFRVSGVRGGMAHLVWWKRMTSPYCSGFPVWGAEWPTMCCGKGWPHPTVQGFWCEGRNGPLSVVEKDDLTLLFRVSGVRGETAHRVWWKRITSPYCSGFPVWGAEWPILCGGKGWHHPTVQGFQCEGRNGPPCVVEKDDVTLLFRVSCVRGGMAHRVWWKRMTSPYCSGFPVWGAERPTMCGEEGRPGVHEHQVEGRRTHQPYTGIHCSLLTRTLNLPGVI